jgi:hypothetical protein
VEEASISITTTTTTTIICCSYYYFSYYYYYYHYHHYHHHHHHHHHHHNLEPVRVQIKCQNGETEAKVITAVTDKTTIYLGLWFEV